MMYRNYSDFPMHPAVPKWLMDGKFGIYTHWGIYSVPAYGPNCSWYPHEMYKEGSPQNQYHKAHYGDPSQFGYKDFIPMFTGEKFDADEWAELFRKSGAKFAGPVAEHHDGFSMWDTRYSEWNSAKMGPKQDVVAKLEKAIRAQDMKFMLALHHAENWFFFPRGKGYDTNEGTGLYGRNHHDLYDQTNNSFLEQEQPDREFLQTWLGKTEELIDRFSPDMLWFDFGLRFIQEQVKQEMIAYYYNHAARNNQDVALTFKFADLPVGSGLIDLEQGKCATLARHPWITDTTIDLGNGWGYLKDTGYKNGRELVHYLVDNVSKNGYLLMNVGPKPNGEIPGEARKSLLEMGSWLEVNGDAVYGTAPWLFYGEGDTQDLTQNEYGEGLSEREQFYNQTDIRYTTKGDDLYAIVLAEPRGQVTLKKTRKILYPGEVQSVELLGYGPCPFQLTEEGLKIGVPEHSGVKYAAAFRIHRKNPLW